MQEDEGKVYSLEVGGRVLNVRTRFYYTKAGKTKIMASVVYSNQFLFALGDNRLHSIQLLAEKVSELHKLNPEQDQSKDNRLITNFILLFFKHEVGRSTLINKPF